MTALGSILKRQAPYRAAKDALYASSMDYVSVQAALEGDFRQQCTRSSYCDGQRCLILQRQEACICQLL